MTTLELAALRTKYTAFPLAEISFSDAMPDVHQLLDALPDSPRNQLLRRKYADQKSEHSVMFWIVEQDVLQLLSEVVPIDPEPVDEIEEKTTGDMPKP